MRGRRVASTRAAKLPWSGLVLSVQPRIRLTRSFDERTHSYLGYVLRLDGRIGEEEREFTVAVSKAQHEKHGLRVGDELNGFGVPVADPRIETAELSRVSGLRRSAAETPPPSDPPPWNVLAPPLPVYRERGHRRLAARTYATRCATCTWGCEMPVEMIVDHWNPSRRRYRRETFCYGPLSCSAYRAGPTRKVPGRRGMSYEEEDWVDEEATGHRGPDD